MEEFINTQEFETLTKSEQECAEALIKNWTKAHKNLAAGWAEGGHRPNLDAIPKASGKLRNSMLSEMSSSGEHRINDAGEKEHKLYRAAPISDKYHETQNTSWTQEPDFARHWAKFGDEKDKMHVMHAWVPEKHIHSFLPTVLRPMNSDQTDEQETIVQPHKFNIAHSESGKELKRNSKNLKPTPTQLAIHRAMAELNKSMENIESIDINEWSNLSKTEQEYVEELAKKCPRCGSKSANSSNPAGRCRAHLNKLASDKKKPGHWQRAQTKFDDSKRRENGKNGTASRKSKGRVKSRKDFVSRFKNDEKKTGSKLSPDRKDNSRGYESKNVRNVPEKLNRGRHKVDPKKLATWRSKLKKSGLEMEDFMILIQAKALEQNNQELAKSLEVMDLDRLMSYMGFYDEEIVE